MRSSSTGGCSTPPSARERRYASYPRTGPRNAPMSSRHKDIPVRDRLIFAMDVADAEAARSLAERLGDSVGFYKLGLELFMAGGYFELIDWMVSRGKKVFVDLKFFDVPA